MRFPLPLPGSLFGRLAVLLVSAFLLLHAATSLTVSFFVESHAARNELADQAGSIALCLYLLEHAEDAAERAVLVARLARLDALEVSLTQAPQPPAQDNSDLSLYLRDRLLDDMADLSGAPPERDKLLTRVRRVSREHGASASFGLPALPGADGEPPRSPWQGDRGGNMGDPLYQSRLAARLEDGTWASLSMTSSVPAAAPLSLLMLSVEILLMALLVLFMVHRVVRPLRMLAQTAERFDCHMGYDEALPETGPTEVREAANAFNRMRDRIRAALDQHERMLASVAHDLRTPLTRMRLRLENISSTELRNKLRADLDALTSIMASSAELSRGNGRREAAVLTDMTAFLESLVADRQDMGQNVSFSGQCGEPFAVRTGALRRCLENLLDNAQRYAGGAQMRAQRQGGRLFIDVLDNGPGIPEAELQQVFEPFYRLEPSRSRHTGGSGLGLAIARAMAQLAGGEVLLFNRNGGGLCARVVLHARAASKER